MQDLVNINQQSIELTSGCTEPAAIAYCAGFAGKYLQEPPTGVSQHRRGSTGRHMTPQKLCHETSHKQKTVYFLTIAFTCYLLFASTLQASTVSCSTQALTTCLENQPSTTLKMVIAGTDSATIDRALLSLYIKSKMQPLWLDSDKLKPKAEALLKILSQSSREGLDPSNYKIKDIEKLRSCRDETSLARLDILLTMGLGRYVADMREGSADPHLLNPELFAAARVQEVDILQIVNDALRSDDLTTFLHNQAPAHAAYQGLRKSLARFRVLEQQGGWGTIPAGQLLKPNMKDSRLPLIAKRLQITGELDTLPANRHLYGPEIVVAVKKFQRHFNLEPDGIIGNNTLSALNIPASQLIRQIITNMERWRWLPHRLDGKRIFVNIAGYQLFGATDEQLEITMPVIVGKVYHKTPVFTGEIRYMEVNPYWNIPNSIAEHEMIPHMQNDPEYLSKHHIRIFKGWEKNTPEIDPTTIDWNTIGKQIRGYRLRQDPGTWNALGQIKFIFPNTHNIYLHDTPTQGLFEKTKRTFSHGCIRVSRPLDLGAYLLQGNRKPLNAEQLRELIATQEQKKILLDKRLPIHILYRTVKASVTSNEVFFYPDIYGRDALLATALFGEK